MMNGIDISHWQHGLNLSKIKCDFVIVKATEGVNFLDSCFDDFMRQAESLGKCMGFYHFARPDKNSAKAEAKFFYNNTAKYFGKAIPILDWETGKLSDVAWVKEWLDEIYSMTGIRPMLYTSESVVKSCDWSSVANANYGLWIAKYKDHKIDRNYDMTNAGKEPVVKWWKFYAMWQWTSSGRLDGYSGNLDCDIFFGSKEAWNKYAGKSAQTVAPKPQPKPTVSTTKIHIVKAGETLSGIAKKYNTTVDALVKKNGIKDKNKIYIGQRLKV